MAISYPDARSNFYKENTDSINRHWATNERIFLLQYFGLTSSTQSNSDLYKQLFNSLGYTGSLSDMWYQFLTEEGYPGALREKQRDFWVSGSFIPVTNLLIFNSSSVPEDGKLYSGTSGQKRQIQPGRCYLTDGVNDYVNFGNIADLSFERTDVLELEVSVQFTSAGSMSAFSKMSPSSPFRGWDIAFNAGRLIFYLIGTFSSSVIAVQTVAQFQDGLPHAIKINYDGSSLASGVVITVDEVVQSTTTLYDNLTTTIVNTNVASIGARNGTGTKFLGRVWGAKATQNGVLKLHAKCDEADGTTSYDSSGNGNDGTITNATLTTFHSTQDNYSYQNQLGYTDGTGSNGAAVGVYIPRDEAIPTQDVIGNALEYTDRAKNYALLKQSSCGYLDGVNDFGATTIPSNYSANMVAFFEFQPKAVVTTNSGAYRVFQLSQGGSTRFGLAVDGSKVIMVYNTGSFTLSTGVAVAIDDYVKACVRISGTTLQLFVNGSLIDSVTGTLLSVDSEPIRIGASNQVASRWFDGKVWNTQFYNSALTEAQCEQLTTDGIPIASNQEAIFPICEDNGINSFDLLGTHQVAWKNITPASFWSGQDVYHKNMQEGASRRMYFNGTDTSINLNQQLVPSTGDYDITFNYFHETATSDTNAYLFSQGATISTYFGVNIFTGDNIRLYVRGGAGGVTASKLLVDSTLYKIGLTRVGNVFSLLVDDVLVGSLTLAISVDVADTIISDLATSPNRETKGLVYDITKDGVIYYKGTGSSNADWTDQVGSDNATVTGTSTDVFIPNVDGSVDAFGSTLTNPTVAGHNGTEGAFDFRNVALGGGVSPTTAHLADVTNFTAFTFDVDTGWDSYDYAFYRQENNLKNDRFLLYSEDLTGDDLANAERYTGN